MSTIFAEGNTAGVGMPAAAGASAFDPPLRELLDPIHRRLLGTAGGDGEIDVGHVVDELVEALRQLRARLPRPVWDELCRVGFDRHPLHALLHEDPMAAAAWRAAASAGAAGAVEVYLSDSPAAARSVGEAGPMGRAVHRAMRHLPLARALRNRRGRVAAMIDAAAEAIPRPRVLAVGAGRLPGARQSEAAARGDLSELVALDPAAPATLASDFSDDFPRTTVRPAFGDLGDLSDADSTLRRRLGTFDLAYSPSSLDGLPRPAAERFVTGLFDLVRPGGAMLVANFLPAHADAGYMEAILGWRPVRRSAGELENLAADLPPVCAECRRVTVGPAGVVAFLEVHKR